MSSRRRENVWLSFAGKSVAYVAHPGPQEGRIAIVTDVGHGRRWTRWHQAQSLRGRMMRLADGEVVWSRRPDAGVKFAMMLRITRTMVARTPVTRESTKETVKTIAQETPGVPVNLW